MERSCMCVGQGWGSLASWSQAVCLRTVLGSAYCFPPNLLITPPSGGAYCRARKSVLSLPVVSFQPAFLPVIWELDVSGSLHDFTLASGICLGFLFFFLNENI